MKRLNSATALVLAGAILLTACNKGQETVSDDTSSEPAATTS